MRVEPDWRKLAVAATGVLLPAVGLHTATFVRSAGMRLALDHLRAVGCQRIALAVPLDLDFVVDRDFYAAYYGHARVFGCDARVPPFRDTFDDAPSAAYHQNLKGPTGQGDDRVNPMTANHPRLQVESVLLPTGH